MFDHNQLLLFFLFTLFLSFGNCWKYCQHWKKEDDYFGVDRFEVRPRSFDAVQFKLKGFPENNIGRGGGDYIPQIKLKLYESKSKKVLYSDTKDLCDHTECSLKKHEKAIIKVRVNRLEEKLKRDVYYTGEIEVIDKCGCKKTCVQDKFCFTSTSIDDLDVSDEDDVDNEVEVEEDNTGNDPDEIVF